MKIHPDICPYGRKAQHSKDGKMKTWGSPWVQVTLLSPKLANS
jgi:hypothetical protein